MIIRRAFLCKDSNASVCAVVRLECQTWQAYSRMGCETLVYKHNRSSVAPERFSSFRKCILDATLDEIALTCCVHLRSFDTYTPSNLNEDTLSMMIPFRLSCVGGSFNMDPISTSFVFCTWNFVAFSVDCWTSLSTCE